MSIKKNISALKIGQELIELGLKIQKKEIPLKVVIDKIDPDFLVSVTQNIAEWEEDISPCDRISALMEIQGINKAELSRKLNVSRQYVTDLLNGKKAITLKSAKKIADALEVPVSGILAAIK